MLAGHAHVPAQVASILLQNHLVQDSSVSLEAQQTCCMNTPVIGAQHRTRFFSQHTGSAHAVVLMQIMHCIMNMVGWLHWQQEWVRPRMSQFWLL